MRRSLMLVLVAAFGVLIFPPAAFAQDDNPSGDDLRDDDRGGERALDDNPSADDLREDDLVASASPTASASSTASATPTATADASTSPDGGTRAVLPNTGGTPTGFALAAAGVLLIGAGIVATTLRRRTS